MEYKIGNWLVFFVQEMWATEKKPWEWWEYMGIQFPKVSNERKILGDLVELPEETSD